MNSKEPSSHASRPSVRNLGELSVVKRRLAELQRTKSAPTTTSPAAVVRPLHQNTRTSGIQSVPMSHKDTGDSLLAEAIIDSYAASPYDSPTQSAAPIFGRVGHEATSIDFHPVEDEKRNADQLGALNSFTFTHDQAADYESQANGLKQQIDGLRQEVRGMLAKFGRVTASIQSTAADDTNQLLQFVGDLLFRVESIISVLGDDRQQTRAMLINIHEDVRDVAAMGPSLRHDTAAVTENMNRLQMQWRKDMTKMSQTIDSILERCSSRHFGGIDPNELSAIHAKLHALVEGNPLLPSSEGPPNATPDCQLEVRLESRDCFH
jgi:hypothetical protein